MRKEPFATGDYVHVYNRGNRKQPIVLDESDRQYFLKALFYFNAEQAPENAIRESLRKSDFRKDGVGGAGGFEWSSEWLPRKPLVSILAFALMGNHYHLLLREIQDEGISRFMRKFGTGITNRFNTKYEESGSLFQGAYKAKRVTTDEYLKYLSVYIQVKNPFELYPGGIETATKDFDRAFAWAIQYPYCSLGCFISGVQPSIIDNDLIRELFTDRDREAYKAFVKDCILVRELDAELAGLTFE